MPSEARGRRRAAAVALLGLLALTGCGGPPPAGRNDARPAFSVARTLQAPSESGYARALEPRPFRFPADHGSHPAFRTEWWYFTGNLATAEGRRFGYQLTFFRSALAPPPLPAVPRPSAWGARQAWLGHFAVGDFEEERFRAFEIWGREALGIAGAEASPLRVWLRGWSAEAEGLSPFPLRLRASAPNPGAGDTEPPVAIDLHLAEGKPPVPQGDRGLSRKSAEPGNASYYYSLPRMPTRGEIATGGERHRVSGESWMDREWSTSALGVDQVGWDWVSLQLSDGRELMLYRLRRRDGSADPSSSGTLIEADGSTRRLSADEFRIEALGRWKSPRSGSTFPSGWRLRLPALDLDLTVRPLLADQELRLSFHYWEGAVEVAGARPPLAGRGFVELTGY